MYGGMPHVTCSYIDKCIFIGVWTSGRPYQLPHMEFEYVRNFGTRKQSGPSKHRGPHFRDRKRRERGNQSGPFDHCLDGPDCRQVLPRSTHPAPKNFLEYGVPTPNLWSNYSVFLWRVRLLFNHRRKQSNSGDPTSMVVVRDRSCVNAC